MQRRGFKALVYQYLGIYLATVEENVYVQSEEFWKAFYEIMGDPENDMGARDVQGLLIGLWQSNRGFYRNATRFSFRRAPVFQFLDFLGCFWLTLKHDVKQIFRL